VANENLIKELDFSNFVFNFSFWLYTCQNSEELGKATKRVGQKLDPTGKRASEGGKSRREGSEDSTHASEDSIFMSFLLLENQITQSHRGRGGKRTEENRRGRRVDSRVD
jgi:hypothetical protein